MNGLFIQLAANPETRFFYFAWVLTAIVSITLHELAHGWAAIKRGDPTPIVQGRMTFNPIVHMGPLSLLFLFLIGFAFGQMPVDSTRLRGKYAEAFVAFAGPLSNFVLAFVTLTALGLTLRFVGSPEPGNQVAANAVTLATVFGLSNIFLGLLNLIPLPPLDGSHILANFHRGYANWVRDPANAQWAFLGILAIFILGPSLFGPAMSIGYGYLDLLIG